MDELKRTVPIWKNPVFQEKDVPFSVEKSQDSLGSTSLRT